MFASFFRKRHKKKLQRERNKHLFLMQQMHEQQLAETERDGTMSAPKVARAKPERSRQGKKEDKQQELWSSKMQEIRNLNTDRKRASQERWNRFAGTEGGGGRGL